MSLTYRFRKWLGMRHEGSKEYVRDRYWYEVTHLNGETSTCEGNFHVRDEGFVIIYEADKDTWAMATVLPHHEPLKPAFTWKSASNKVRELEGIQEVERTKIGEDIFDIRIDYATNTVLDVEKTFHRTRIELP